MSLTLRSGFAALVSLALGPCLLAQTPTAAPPPASTPGAPAATLPTGMILVNGAAASASDRTTPLPEEGTVAGGAFDSRYFGLSYRLPASWTEAAKGPPPSDSGRYVLAQLVPSDAISRSVKGSILISAQDLFFNMTPGTSVLELARYAGEHLPSYYQLDRAPAAVTLGDHPFVRFDYSSPTAGLHWSVVSTAVRCHALQFVFTARDAAALDKLVAGLGQMKLPQDAGLEGGSGGGDVPLCIADYARPETVLERVEPFLPTRRYNAIPARIVIDREGKVKHVHLISAFPEQVAAVTEALMKWKFRPYLRNGEPVEVETGLLFGNSAAGPRVTGRPARPPKKSSSR